MARKTRTLAFVMTGGAVLAGLVWLSLRSDPVPVDLATVTRTPMRVSVNADGRTRIRDVYEIAAPIAGTARRSPVAVGDQVVQGETVVAVVEPLAPPLLDERSRMQAHAAVDEATAALRLAEAQLRQAEQELSHARNQHERARLLSERGVSSAIALEDASQILAIRLAAREAASSAVQMATGSLDRARAVLVEPLGGGTAPDGCCVSIRAPISGTVLSVASISEHPVTPGMPLLSVGRPDDLEIVSDLLSADAVRLAVGAATDVERWGGPDPLRAELQRIEPSAVTRVSALGIEEQRVDAVFSLLTPPEQRLGLGDGFAVFLHITVWQAEEVLQVPLSALFRDGEGWAVFVFEGGLARRVPVRIGQRNGSAAEILSGVVPGARVVTHPSDAVADGTPIIERALP